MRQVGRIDNPDSIWRDLAFTRDPPHAGEQQEFDYTVEDEDGQQSTATVRIIVTPPTVTALDDGLNGEYGTFDQWDFDSAVDTCGPDVSLGDCPEASVLSNDTDSAGLPLTAQLYDQADHGTVVLRPDGTFIYRPQLGWYGTDTFQYIATDGAAQSEPATVFVNVNIATIEAEAPGAWEGAKTIGSSLGALGIVPPPPQAWVGQRITLYIGQIGPAQLGLGANSRYNWAFQGKAVAGYHQNEQEGYVIPISLIQTRTDTPSIYWVDRGLKSVQVQVTRPDKAPLSLSGNVDILRPNANLTSVTDQVRQFVTSSPWVEFGNFAQQEDPGFPRENLKNGIEFIKHFDPNALASGEYQLTQLIYKQSYRQSYNPDPDTGLFGPLRPYRKVSNGFVLDGHVFMSVPWDSPGVGFGDDDRHYSREDEFRTYMMWNPQTPGSIWVPLRVTAWSWGFVAHYGPTEANNVGGWVLDSSHHSTNPPSTDTTEFPEWNGNVTSLEWVEDD